jgi:hypothetical protein
VHFKVVQREVEGRKWEDEERDEKRRLDVLFPKKTDEVAHVDGDDTIVCIRTPPTSTIQDNPDRQATSNSPINKIPAEPIEQNNFTSSQSQVTTHSPPSNHQSQPAPPTRHPNSRSCTAFRLGTCLGFAKVQRIHTEGTLQITPCEPCFRSLRQCIKLHYHSCSWCLQSHTRCEGAVQLGLWVESAGKQVYPLRILIRCGKIELMRMFYGIVLLWD